MFNRMRFWMLVAGVCVGITPSALAAPLDPNGFTSLGTLNISSGMLTIDTSTLQVAGAASFTGVVHAQGGGLPDIAVFAFDNINIGSGVTVTVSGARPVALLSKGNAVVGAALDVSAVDALFETVGGAAGPGGAGGGDGGVHDPPLAPTAGAGPGGGGVSGGGGGFGGAGGLATQGPTSGGPAYGNLATGLQGGSGGAGHNAMIFPQTGDWYPGSAGGGGGGAVEIGAIGQIQLASVTSRGGGAGDSFLTAGGGGSGGAVLLHGTTISISGSIIADGGESMTPQFVGGVGGGGGGGGGRVLAIPATYVLGAATPTASVAGGAGGGGMSGSAGVAEWAPTLTVIPSGQARLLDAAGVLSETLAGGFTLRGSNLQVDAGGLAFATAPVTSAFSVALNGGSLQAGLGWTMSGLGKLSGFGQVAGAFAGSASNQILANGGTLAVGDANSPAGFSFAGTIDVAAGATLDLRDSNKAALGSATTLASGARLSSLNGADLGVGKTLSASGAAQVDGKFTNQGAVNGPAAADQFLTFTDDVDGPGNYTGNVLFSDGFSPGSSPAAVSLQNVAFDASSTLTIELGGISAGAQYDQLNATGTATLGGTMDVVRIGDFMPGLGNSFSVLNFGSRLGDFASYTGLDIGGFLQLRPQFAANALVLKARPEVDGDINLDGAVDIFDINSVSSNWGTAGPQGDANGDGIVNIFDINLISSNWGATGGGSGQAAVPEPSALLLASTTLLGFILAGWTRGGACKRRVRSTVRRAARP
jgi:hypothetical protein